MANTIFKGVVHGRTIELDQEPGVPDGETVTVAIQRDIGSPPTEAGVVPPVESWCERIVFDPAVSPIKKVVRGTRLLAEELVAELAGSSDANLVRSHPELGAEDVTALRQYARWPVGLRQAFGAWADDAAELDEYLDWTRQNRKHKRREIEE